MAESEKENETTSRENHFSVDHSNYEEVILKTIQPIFERFIYPHNVLRVFWKYDINVLVRRDIQLIEAVTNNSGTAAGATKLLDLLPSYRNWFPCLLQVLRDDEVRQEHVAEMIICAIEKIQSDTNVDVTVKELAAKDILIEKLKAELEKIRSETHVDKTLKKLAKKDILIVNLKTELEDTKQNLRSVKNRLAVKEKELVLAEKNIQEQNKLIEKLRIDLEDTKKRLKNERDKNSSKGSERKTCEEKETLEQKIQAEEDKQDQVTLIDKKGQVTLKDKRYQITLIDKQDQVTLKDKQDQVTLRDDLSEKFDALINGLLKNSTDKSMLESLMLRFAESGQYSAMETLIKRGVDINKVYSAGKTALIHATEAGYVECVNLLVSNGSKVDVKDSYSCTALSYAAYHGRADCVQALLEAGSCELVNIPLANGETTLMLAAKCKGDNVLCIQMILDAGADIDKKDMVGNTALAHAAKSGNANCVQALLEAGSHKHINNSNTLGQTPLMLAAGSKGDNVQCLRYLLSSHADPDIRDSTGDKALQYASKNKNMKCEEALQGLVPDIF